MENNPPSPSSKSANRLQHLSACLGCAGTILVLCMLNERPLVAGIDPLLLLIPIGASSVLVFGTPHSPFASMRAVLSGHSIAAFLGVCCARWIPHEAVAAGTAVGLSLACMHATRCLHPPAGASALLAVMGGESIRALGFTFVLNPILSNAAILCVAGLLFHRSFNPQRNPMH